MDVPETPYPSYVKDEDEEEVVAFAEVDELPVEIEQPAAAEEETALEEQPAGQLEEMTGESQLPEATAPLTIEVSTVSNATGLAPLVLPFPTVEYIATKRPFQRRSVHKRWQRGIQGQQKHKRTLRIASLVIVAALFLFVLLPAGAGVAASFPDDAYREAGATLGDPWDSDGVVKVRKPSGEERAMRIAAWRDGVRTEGDAEIAVTMWVRRPPSRVRARWRTAGPALKLAVMRDTMSHHEAGDRARPQ